LKVLYFILSVATIGFGVISATRSMVLCVFAVAFVCFLLKLILDKLDWKRFLNLLLVLLAIVLLIGIVFLLIFPQIIGSALFTRFITDGILDTSRADLFVYYVSNLIKYPFGGRNVLQQYSQASHNVFLDVYDSYGVFPFFLLVLFVVLVVKSIVQKILHGVTAQGVTSRPNIVYLYTGCTIAFIFMCFIEPCTYSNISSIWVMLFLFGTITEEINAERKEMEI